MNLKSQYSLFGCHHINDFFCKRIYKLCRKFIQIKSGNISSYPYSCALRAGASYNYLLVDGERRLTPREMLRLQGFPDEFKIAVSDAQTTLEGFQSAPTHVAKICSHSFPSKAIACFVAIIF